MLFASRESGVRRFIYAASSSVYGDHPGLPKVEERIGKPLSPYAITKYVNELFAENFSGIYGIEIIGLRYFNVFGRRQDPGGAYAAVIPRFAKALLNHESPVINGDGSISRDFTHVDNVIQANHLSAVTENKLALNQVYNIACGESTTLNRLFSMMLKICARYDNSIGEIKPVHGPARPGDVMHSLASIGKAEKLLGYSPVKNIEQGLEEAIRWFRDNM
jgi:UDP-N-acetylglucosamine 4-epimerase